ncbi:MAG TPA: hypothetical protein VFZ83_13250 [Acidimicrobiia bacterium]|nr:hypothetical protein [Acidimicrobiia bacterium]
MPDESTPTPDEAKSAWDAVGDQFAALGARLKEQFDARVAFEDKEKVAGAVKTLVESIDTAFRAVADSVREPEVREQMRLAVNSLGDAVQKSLDTASKEVKDRFGSKSDAA